MEEKEFEKRLAKLETVNDQLQSELNHLNYLLKKFGFDEGVKTLKEAVQEMLDSQKPGGPNQNGPSH